MRDTEKTADETIAQVGGRGGRSLRPRGWHFLGFGTPLRVDVRPQQDAHDDRQRRGAALGQSARQPLGQRYRQGEGRGRAGGLAVGDDEPRQSRPRGRMAAGCREAGRTRRG